MHEYRHSGRDDKIQSQRNFASSLNYFTVLSESDHSWC